MEKDCICSHGTMRMLYEKFYDDSDGAMIHLCRNCGNRAVVNEELNIYRCKSCGDNADIANIPSSWVANVLFNEAGAMNIKLNFELDPHMYPRMDL